MTDPNRREEVAQPGAAAQPGQRQTDPAGEPARQSESPNDTGTGNTAGTATGDEVPGQPFVVRDKRRKPSPRPRPDGGRPEQAPTGVDASPGPAGTAADQPPGTATEVGDAAQSAGPATAESPAGGFAAELEALRSELEERTKDLQRITAEYANYRRRIERDRRLVVEQATAGVLNELLGVLDDLDRARSHGDLVGPFGAVAEQLASVLAKLGLSPFGEKGDAFDPTRHEAVAHSMSAEVTEPTCVEVFRRGYQYGERLLRPALVAVADPAEEEPARGVAKVPEAPAEPTGSAAAGDAPTEDRPAGDTPGGSASGGTGPGDASAEDASGDQAGTDGGGAAAGTAGSPGGDSPGNDSPTGSPNSTGNVNSTGDDNSAGNDKPAGNA